MREQRSGLLLLPGFLHFADAWALQRRLAEARANGSVSDTLILLQHYHTYTLGRSALSEHLLMSESERRAKGVSVNHVDRGGDVTYHGPGQLVGYPILDLGRPQLNGRLPKVDYVGYLRRIEDVLMQTLADWDILARRFPGYTGVWVDRGSPLKVAAIGVKVDAQGISQHGFALNVDPDMGFFEGIVPCGISHYGVTSMVQLLGRPIDLDDVAEAVAAHFGEVFGLQWRQVCLRDLSTDLQG